MILMLMVISTESLMMDEDRNFVQYIWTKTFMHVCCPENTF